LASIAPSLELDVRKESEAKGAAMKKSGPAGVETCTDDLSIVVSGRIASGKTFLVLHMLDSIERHAGRRAFACSIAGIARAA